MKNYFKGLPNLYVLALLGAMYTPSSLADCLGDFQSRYPDSATDGAACATCHTSANSFGSGFNAYGRAFSQNGGCGNASAAFAAIEGLDSDGDANNVSNIDEIIAGAQPGWCMGMMMSGAACAGTPGNMPAGVLLDPETGGNPPPANTPPTASAGGPYTGEAGTPVQFTGTASDADSDPLSYAWNFGDGGSSDVLSPTHNYASGGSFTVTLTVSDGTDSIQASTTAQITEPVVNVAPTANPGGPYAGEPDAPVAFNGSASSDPNSGDTLTYAWEFGDGGTADGVAPSHSYAAEGRYTVTLTVTDTDGLSNAATTVAEIAIAVTPPPATDGEALYTTNCAGCHGSDPWADPAYDETLPGLRRMAGARECSIIGSIYGTSEYPDGVPMMQYLQGLLSEDDVASLAQYLNSRSTSGAQRYVTACAGCHGADGSGGPSDEDVHGEDASETAHAIMDEDEMVFLACMPESDLASIGGFLMGMNDDFDNDGIRDRDDMDDDNDGINDDMDDDDDNDGLNDDDEHHHGSDPRDHDSDNDGIDDGEEVNEHHTNPMDHDSDDDGLTDGEEINEHGTDPNDEDTDDDGYSDGTESKIMGTDPLVANAPTGTSTSSGGGGAFGLFLLIGLMLGRAIRSNSDQ